MTSGDRWPYAWGVGYAAVGMASLLVPLYALTLGGGALAVGALASTAAFAAFWGPLPAYLGAEYSDGVVFWLFLSANLASTVCYGPGGRLASERGPRALQNGALSLRIVLFPLVGAIVIGLTPPAELPLLLATFALIGVTWAVIAITGASLVTRLAGTARADALGFYTALGGLGGGFGSVLGGWIASISSYPIAFVVAGTGVFASVLLGVAITRQ